MRIYCFRLTSVIVSGEMVHPEPRNVQQRSTACRGHVVEGECLMRIHNPCTFNTLTRLPLLCPSVSRLSSRALVLERQTTTSLESNVRNNNQVLTVTWNLTWWRSSATITWQTSPGSSRRSRRGNETHHPGEDQLEDRTHQAEQDQAHQDFRRISTLIKLLMCLLQCSERFLRFKRRTERVGQRDPTSGFKLDLRYRERAY